MLPPVTATASSSSLSQGMTPAKTVDGSGFDAATGLHSTLDSAMWLSTRACHCPRGSSMSSTRPASCRRCGSGIRIRRSNCGSALAHKDVTIEYSLDGATWMKLSDVTLPQADSTEAYAGTTIDLAGVQAKFVRLTINSNWNPGGFITQTGLSEVRFYYVPVKARLPQPASGATGVSVDTMLSCARDARPPRTGSILGWTRMPWPMARLSSIQAPGTATPRARSISVRPTTGKWRRSMRPRRPVSGRATYGASPRSNTPWWMTSRATRTTKAPEFIRPGSMATPRRPAAR